jgi:hypothetical protein
MTGGRLRASDVPMKRRIFAVLFALVLVACNPTEREGTSPSLDTVESGAPLEGVGPDETQDDIEDEGP